MAVEVGKELTHIKAEEETLCVLKGIKQRGLGGCFFCWVLALGFFCCLFVFFFFLLGFGKGKDKRCLLSGTCSCHHTQAGFRS